MGDKIMTFRGEYEFLSNMYPAEFDWDGRHYLNSEAAFQSAKVYSSGRDEFSDMDGKTAKRRGRRVLLREDWEQVKELMMQRVVRAKFTQNPELREKLIATGDRLLVEGNTWNDTYWGVSLRTGQGRNRLGVILMKLREELGGAPYVDPDAPSAVSGEERGRLAEQFRLHEEKLSEFSSRSWRARRSARRPSAERPSFGRRGAGSSSDISARRRCSSCRTASPTASLSRTTPILQTAVLSAANTCAARRS